MSPTDTESDTEFLERIRTSHPRMSLALAKRILERDRPETGYEEAILTVLLETNERLARIERRLATREWD